MNSGVNPSARVIREMRDARDTRDPPLGRLAQARLRGLAQRFERIARTRMAGLPIVHPGLRVALEGFREQPWLPASPGAPVSSTAALEIGCVGVLLTPWSMSLLRLPLALSCAVLPVGHRGVRRVGQGASAQVFDFLGGREEGLGPFELCSLFSPMTEFADQAGAVATARAVMDALYAVVPVAASVPAPAVPPVQAVALDEGSAQAVSAPAAAPSPPHAGPVPQPTRRWFLRGGVTT